MKSWRFDPQKIAEDTQVGHGEKYPATEDDVQDFIDDMNASQKQHAFDPNDWFDWSVSVSKMTYDEMKKDKKFRALAIRTFHFRDKKVDISGIDFDPTDADELFDDSHIVKDRFTNPYKGDKKQQLKARLKDIGRESYKKTLKDNNMTGERLKARLGAVGINFPEEPKEPKTLADVQAEHALKQRKVLNTPKKKPTDEDFSKIISAARDKIKEAKTDKDHNHHIEYFTTKKGVQKTAQLVADDEVSTYKKYWILNAKQTNGNNWGVSPSTIDANIQHFVGMPFVITAKSWIPNSEYGETKVHPYLPTNNLRFIYAHQEKFTAGIIKKIMKDDKDDYYAMIKPLPQFASRVFPPFCSPGIYQLDRTEPADNISKWLPLHLAGLDEDPAYGAHVAALKGSCLGTENECFVQFKGAKLELISTCPIKSAKVKELKKRLSKLKKAQAEGTTNAFNMTYDKSKPTKVKKKQIAQEEKPEIPSTEIKIAQDIEPEPLDIQFNGESIMDNGTIQIGKLTASERADEDWHEYSINLVNVSGNELRAIQLETNLGDDYLTHKLPESLGANQSCPATIRIRASKFLKAEIHETPYIIMKYREVRHY